MKTGRRNEQDALASRGPQRPSRTPLAPDCLQHPLVPRVVVTKLPSRCPEIARILLANSNQWYFNNLVKNPCHKTHCRCPHHLKLSFKSSRSCALPNIKLLKDKDLEFANSIRPFMGAGPCLHPALYSQAGAVVSLAY